jgi:hypothetical protein
MAKMLPENARKMPDMKNKHFEVDPVLELSQE